jgi:CRISPR-associated endonuclease Csn1
VDKSLVKMMQGQFPAGTSFREACEQGIYTIRKSDNRRLARMRHVRCFATTVTNPIKLKKQTYLSKKEYKQYVYTQSGDLYTMVKYSNKHKTIFVPYSLWDISENRKVGKDDIPSIIYRDKMEFTKGCSLVLNDMLLLYGKNENPLRLSEEEIINRLYVVKGFEKTGCIIKLVQHICAKGDTELGKGESVKNWKNLPEKIRCGISTINFLILGVDFEFDVKTNKVRFGVH